MKVIMKSCILFILLNVSVFNCVAQFEDPFEITIDKTGESIELYVSIPSNHYIYSDKFVIEDDEGNFLKPESYPQKTNIIDPASGDLISVYSRSFSIRFDGYSASSNLKIRYWGCNDSICFMPQEILINSLEPITRTITSSSLLEKDSSKWSVIGRAYGFLNVNDFINFIDKTEQVNSKPKSAFFNFITNPNKFIQESGFLFVVIFILIGGLALNLTPCVLPMIPINIAIIGAGAQASSRKRGFTLGSVYGLGIALVYGLLGIGVVLTGSQFGVLQSNPWFNLVISLIFIILGLAVFGFFNIDFSSIQSGKSTKNKGRYALAFSMGSIAALLAGACVAPIVIAVLILASNLYISNPFLGLSLPFLLGLGMALPWPFAGAGLSFLPKPGKWMEKVKIGFGVIIFGFAIYYGSLSYKGFVFTVDLNKSAINNYIVIDGKNNNGLDNVFSKAISQDKFILLDFWASWCKNCKLMDQTTFSNQKIKDRLESYIFVKYVAEDPTHPRTREVLEKYNVKGFPTYIVLDHN